MRVNRVVIATDGVFKLDRKDRKLIKTQAKNNVFLSTFHYNTSITEKKKAKTLQKIARFGKGVYKLINNNTDVKKALIGEAKQMN